MSFGTDLRQQREQQGVSLEQISEATRVSIHHLRALEADDHGALPGGVFNRGIVQSYARFLQLNEDVWLDRYKQEVAGESRNENWAEFAEAVKRSRTPSGSGQGSRWFGVLAMVVVLAGLAWAAWHFVVQHRLHG